MKKYVKYLLTVALPLAGLTAMLGSCASTPCNNDYCYNRSLSSLDGFEEGEIAAWGTEKYEAHRQKRSYHDQGNRK